MVDSLIVKLLQ